MRRKDLSALLLATAWLSLVPAARTLARTSDEVLVVVNDNSDASKQIADYYVRKRGIAARHVVHLTTSASDEIGRLDYERTIEQPTAAFIQKNQLQDAILYIVLTKGVPLRIAGTQGMDGSIASVDSELTLLYRRMVGTAAPVGGRVDNPYFLGDKALSQARPFNRQDFDVYLVTRLDAYSVDDVIKLIDRGTAPGADGGFVLDQKSTLIDRGGDGWLQEAAVRLRGVVGADHVLLETTPKLAPPASSVMGYYSWGSNDPGNRVRHFGMGFVPGAIGGMFVSTDGRTFTAPPERWLPGGGPASAGGGSQSLAGDLIRDGITGVSAHVAEPYLDATIRPQVLFPAYVAGFNLAESYYLAMPFLSWQTVVIGDPLCEPYPRIGLKPQQVADEIDPETELPALFSQRRLANVSRTGYKPEALKLMMRADVVVARDGSDAAEPLWEKALALEPRLTGAELALAARNEVRGEYDTAMERYRSVLKKEPANVIALNNLAYALAERKQAPGEALPLAEQAYRLSPQPIIADTLGWIHHLLGDDRAAAPFVERAAAGAGTNAEVALHAAFVHAALGERARAAAELDAALKLDPKLGERQDVIALRARIKGDFGD